MEYALRSFVGFLNFESMINVSPFSSILTISSAESDQNNRQSESSVRISINGTHRSSIVFYPSSENFLINLNGILKNFRTIDYIFYKFA